MKKQFLFVFLSLLLLLGTANAANDPLLVVDSTEVKAKLDDDKKKLAGETKKLKGAKKVVKLFTSLFKKKSKKKTAPAASKAQVKSTPKDSNTVSSRISVLKDAGKLVETLAESWDSIHQIKHVMYHSPSDTVKHQVFGFHPYWMGSSYKSYDYELLSSIAYFAFELDPSSGKFKSTRDWATTAMVDSAKKHTCKVYFTITNFTGSNNRRFLKSKDARKKCIEQSLEQLSLRNADGIVVDFEDVPDDLSEELTSFIKELSVALDNVGKKLCMTVPAIDNHGAYDVDEMINDIEFFLLMGYDYYGSWSKEAGPIAPLNSQPMWGSYSIESSVDNYLHRGVNPSQLILVVPYYGGIWEVSDTSLPAPKVKFKKHVLYRESRRLYEGKASLDHLSKTAFYNLTEGDTRSQIWFDSKEALAHKYDLILKDKLAGAGIWALGYDNGSDDLWKLLEHKFGNVALPDSVVKEMMETSVLEKEAGEINIGSIKEILADIVLLKLFFGLIATILILSFMWSLRRKAVREIVLQFPLFSLVFLLILPSVCLYIILFTSHTAMGCWTLLGMLLGYGIYYLKEHSQYRINKRIP